MVNVQVIISNGIGKWEETFEVTSRESAEQEIKTRIEFFNATSRSDDPPRVLLEILPFPSLDTTKGWVCPSYTKVEEMIEILEELRDQLEDSDDNDETDFAQFKADLQQAETVCQEGFILLNEVEFAGGYGVEEDEDDSDIAEEDED